MRPHSDRSLCSVRNRSAGCPGDRVSEPQIHLFPCKLGFLPALDTLERVIAGTFCNHCIGCLFAGASTGGAEFVGRYFVAGFFLSHLTTSEKNEGQLALPLKKDLFDEPHPAEFILQPACLDAGQSVIQLLGYFTHLATGQM
jgi:hypothetical protein